MIVRPVDTANSSDEKKLKFLIGGTLLLGLAIYAWSKRDVNIQIADVRFRFPAQAVISSSSGGARDGLDCNSGAFIVLPKGPYYGNWGLLLQSSKDRHADGMPSGLKDALSKGDLHLAKTSFGWIDCDGNCGRRSWFFHRLPGRADSIYSVGTVICSNDTGFCELLLSYRDVDVQVSLERRRLSEASEVMNQVMGLLGNYEITSKNARKAE